MVSIAEEEEAMRVQVMHLRVLQVDVVDVFLTRRQSLRAFSTEVEMGV